MSTQPAPSGTSPQGASGPSNGDVLVVALPFDPGTLYPVAGTYEYSAMIGALVQPGLMRREVHKGVLSYEPALASACKPAADGLSITCTLRDGLSWADEQPLTSADVAFTWEVLRDPTTGSPLAQEAAQITAVDTPDDKTAVLHFATPQNPAWIDDFTSASVLPKHALQGVDRAKLRVAAPLASGPFAVHRWRTGRALVLGPNPSAPADWHPHLDNVVFRVIPDYAQRVKDLEDGAVDLVTSLDVQDAARLQTSDHLTVFRRSAASMRYIGYDLDDPRFSDLRVRKALTMGIDRERLIRDMLTEQGTAYGRYCIGTVSPNQPDWNAGNVLPLPYDPSQAIRLLEHTGWRMHRGVRERRGQRLAFHLLVQAGSKRLLDLAKQIQQYWAPIGVKITIEPVDAPTFADRVREGKYEAFLWGFLADPSSDPSYIWGTDGPYNWFGYSSREVDSLLQQARAASTPAKAQGFVKQVQKVVYEDQPVTFLYWQDAVTAVDRRFQNAHVTPYSLFDDLQSWYVPTAEQKYRGVSATLPPAPTTPAPAPAPAQAPLPPPAP